MIAGVSKFLRAAILFAAIPSGAHAAAFPETGPVPPRRPAELSAQPSPETTGPAQPDAPAPLAASDAPGTTSSAPMPPPRPRSLDQLAALPPRVDPGAPDTLPRPEAPSFCAALLASGRVDGKLTPSVRGDGGCGIDSPIELTAIFLGDGTRVPVEPASLMRCQLADALAVWVRTDLAAAAEKTGSKLARIQSAAAYVCRGRNRIAGARMSEHGVGNAFDLRGLTLANGRVLSIDKSAEARPFMEEMRRSACARFKTILGPGSDGYHEDHVHVDLRERRGGNPFCQWVLR